MLEWVEWFLMSLMYNFLGWYMYAKLTNNSVASINKRNIFLCVFISLFHCASTIFSIQLLTALLKVMFTTILLKKLYNETISKTLITTFLIYLLCAISEIVFAIIFMVILNFDKAFFKTNIFGVLVANISILVLTLLIIKIKIVLRKFSNIIKWYTNNSIVSNVVLIVLSIIVIFTCLLYNYQNVESNELFILINLFFIGVIIFVIGYFKEQTDNNRLAFEYDNLIHYVKTYEELLESKNKNQHEYVNQLILIKSMINNKNKKAIEYIDKVLDTEENSEENIWINKFKNIPNGGLKGLLYYKISDMIKNNVNVYIEISDNVNNKKLNSYLNDNLEDISKIIGVYLDNAKDAIMESDKKYLIVEANCDKEEFNLSISNTFKGNVNLSKVDEEGYTKKGKGHGYGLSLVRDILNKRKDIKQSREINGMYYVQKVSFKYKNK